MQTTKKLNTHENDYEEGCTNDLDDDMDGNVDGDDDDCAAVLALAKDNTILGDLKSADVSGYLVWGVGIGLLSSVGVLVQVLEQQLLTINIPISYIKYSRAKI